METNIDAILSEEQLNKNSPPVETESHKTNNITIDNKIIQINSNKSINNIPRTVTWRGVLLYGTCVLLGNHFANWSVGFKAGFWSFIGIMLIISTSFGCEMLCIAEMTSALPFSGGTYGVVRVTLGDFAGYLVGTAEAFQYILYVAFTTIALGKYITVMTGYNENYEPLYWFIMYTTIIVLLAFRRTLFWKSIWILGIYILVMILLFCTMTIEYTNFNKYTTDTDTTEVTTTEGSYLFFETIQQGSWFFNLAGKIMPLTCSETINPTLNVPKAMYYNYILSIISAFAIVFCVASLNPGIHILKNNKTPLIFGFSKIFDITLIQAISFTFIAKFATCLPYAFAYSIQLTAITKSGYLFQPFQNIKNFNNNTKYILSIFSGSALGFIINVILWFWDKDYTQYVSNGYKILGYLINLTIFFTYIVFKSKFSTLIKTYKSPVGIYGAIYGLVMFSIVFICIGVMWSRTDRWSTFVLLISFLLVWSAPYFLYYRHHLTYSEEESTIMFIAYVINANQARRAGQAKKEALRAKKRSINTLERTPTRPTPRSQLRQAGTSTGTIGMSISVEDNPYIYPNNNNSNINSNNSAGIREIALPPLDGTGSGEISPTMRTSSYPSLYPSLRYKPGGRVSSIPHIGLYINNSEDSIELTNTTVVGTTSLRLPPVEEHGPTTETEERCGTTMRLPFVDRHTLPVIPSVPTNPLEETKGESPRDPGDRNNSPRPAPRDPGDRNNSPRPAPRDPGDRDNGPRPAPTATTTTTAGAPSATMSAPTLTPAATIASTAPTTTNAPHTTKERRISFFPNNTPHNRITPISARETTEARTQRLQDLDHVLTNNLQYDDSVIGQLRSEIQEFYEEDGVSSHCSSLGNISQDENV